MKVNAFILGAPKCGTTSLSAWLAEHPNAFVAPRKEPHFFNTDMRHRMVRSPRAYAALFSAADPGRHLVRLEASTWYLYSRDAVPNIEATGLAPRYIVMTREPSAMAISLFYHNRRSLYEDQAVFEEAWALQDLRATGASLPPRCEEPAFLQYRAVCSLGSLLDRLFACVPRERVLVLSLERIKHDPRREYAKVLRHLGLPDDGRRDFPVLNQAQGVRSQVAQLGIRTAARVKARVGLHLSTGISRLNMAALAKAEIPERTRQAIDAEFAEERQRLSCYFDESCPEANKSAVAASDARARRR